MVAGLTHAIYSRRMDRALKERIIGAVVLVVIAVLVVPVFLDGPAPDAEMISESVTLPGQDGGDDRRTVVLQLDRDQPLPASGSPPEARPVSTSSSTDAGDSAPSPAPAENGDAAPTTVAAVPQEQERPPVSEPEPDPEPPAREQDPPPPATGAGDGDTESATGMWAVQIGSFSNKENADRLAAGLRAKGYAAFLSQVRTGEGELHRVRIGPQKDRGSAEAVALRLAADDVDGQVVPHP